MLYAQRPDVIVQTVEDETLVLDLRTENIHTLNPTASFVWNHCNGELSDNELAELLVKHFDVEIQAARRDVSTLLKQLEEKGLLETRTA